MYRELSRIWSDDRGQDLIEYALLAALISVAAVAFVPTAFNPIRAIGDKISAVLLRWTET